MKVPHLGEKLSIFSAPNLCLDAKAWQCAKKPVVPVVLSAT